MRAAVGYFAGGSVDLAKLAEQIHSGKQLKVRIWSAACSTGQEPYSIAMTVLEFIRKHGLLRPDQVEILGTDISSAALYLAKAGRYDSFAITRGLPKELMSRYFEQDGSVWCIKDEVKRMVSYVKMNLQGSFSYIGRQDIVFCRYILIYFSNSFKKDILSRIGDLLKPDGYLFLGASESIANYSEDYQILQHFKGIYYKVKT